MNDLGVSKDMRVKETSVLFVPGLSSPYGARYFSLYAALQDEAIRCGYRVNEVVLLPGQSDKKGNREGMLSLPTAREKLKHELAGISEDNICIIAFSFGCTVALSALAENTRTIRHVFLWGPIPFWQSWEAFRVGSKRKQLGQSTNMVDDEIFFKDLVPIEFLLPQVRAQVTIGAGRKDMYCRKSYLMYLKQFCKEFGLVNVQFTQSDGEHTPEPNHAGWNKFLGIVLNSNIEREDL